LGAVSLQLNLCKQDGRRSFDKSPYMPPEMISKIDKIVRGRKVNFAKVVREGIDAFDEGLAMENSSLLEALADAMIQTTQDVVKKIEAIEKKLDETHALLEER